MPINKKYPWDRWFNRSRVTIRRGRDYDCMTHGMAAQIRNAASRKGVKISLEISEDDKGEKIVIIVVGRTHQSQKRAKGK